jgi:uncharacterized protein (TIGR02466 family)
MINNLFSTQIYDSKIDNDIFNKLKKDVLEYIDDNEKLFVKNWQCDTLSNVFCEQNEKFLPSYLNELIINHTSKYIIEGGFTPSGFVIDNCWITLGGKGDFQEAHDHLGDVKGSQTTFSGVMYIQAEQNKGGEFFIDSPIDTLSKLLPTNNSNPSKISIPPQEGLLISFPSFIKHGSFIYNSNKKKRISISWNIKFI